MQILQVLKQADERGVCGADDFSDNRRRKQPYCPLSLNKLRLAIPKKFLVRQLPDSGHLHRILHKNKILLSCKTQIKYLGTK